MNNEMISVDEVKVAVIGLGYVGLPLAIEFSKYRPTLGFDIDETRISELREGIDRTKEVGGGVLPNTKYLKLSCELESLRESNLFIVAVPTPIDKNKQPALSPLINACKLIGRVLKANDVVVFESTVYPGCTEEVCIPELEECSGLEINKNLFVGYSPERINPGDQLHSITSIVKITSGSNPETAKFIDTCYKQIIDAGTYKAPSIRVAEAAKVIENTQRDVNIGLVNELALIFNKLNIDTEEVLKAASTKWNFLPFKPGLVGGHCISVDPYYLTYKAREIGYHPDLILAGRRLNDGMGTYVASQLVKAMIKSRIQVEGAKILILGLAFKENCPDIRNTGVLDILRELTEYECDIDVFDPWVDTEEAKKEYGISLISNAKEGLYDAIVIAVGHDSFREMGGRKIKAFGQANSIVYDLKSMFDRLYSDLRL